MAKGLEHITCGKRLKELAFFNLENRQLLWGGTCWQLAIGYMKAIKFHGRRTGDKMSLLHTGKNILSLRTVRHRFPRDVVQSPCLEVLKIGLEKTLSNPFWPQSGSWCWRLPGVSSNLKYTMPLSGFVTCSSFQAQCINCSKKIMSFCSSYLLLHMEMTCKVLQFYSCLISNQQVQGLVNGKWCSSQNKWMNEMLNHNRASQKQFRGTWRHKTKNKCSELYRSKMPAKGSIGLLD